MAESLLPSLGEPIDALAPPTVGVPGASDATGGFEPAQRRIDTPLAEVECAATLTAKPLDQRISVQLRAGERREQKQLQVPAKRITFHTSTAYALTGIAVKLWTARPIAGNLARVREVITTANAPSSPLFSQGVKAGDHIYVSGLVGIDVTTGSLAGTTIQEQTRQALANCQAVLQAAGATLEDVVEVGVLLTNPTDFADMNDEYATWFPAEPPTRYVAKLGVEIPGVLVSIRMTALRR